MSADRTVATIRCADYGAPLATALERLLIPLGGLQRFVRHGQTVLLKPNLLSDRQPEEAVTTHPELVRAVIRLVRRHGGRPAVADSPANAVKLDRVWERTGFGAMCAAESVPLLNLEQRGSVRFEADGCSFTVARPVAEADVVINLPKVKTHMLTTLTAGVKNMYGIVPGFQKTHLHREHPRPSDFGRLMAAIYRTSPPALTIADAVTGMEGDGPSSGSPVRLGFLAASGDAVALDHVLCRMLGIPPSRVAYLTRLCDTDSGFSESAIRVAECSDDPVPPVSLRLPSAVPPSLIPRPLVRLLAPLVWIRPGVSDTCTSCGRCVRACPAAALSAGASGRPPALDPRRCIGCCCCHEVCPAGAIRMVQSPLLSLLRRGPLSGPA